jgi:transposase-like protein
MAARQKTEARWRALVREQESSGRTVREFARSRGLSAASLYWWRSQLRRSGRERGARVALAPVTLLRSDPSSRSMSGGFEVVLRNGRRVIVPADYDAESLRHLVAELERGC